MPLESVGYLQFGCAKLRSQFTLLHANRDKLYLRPIRNLIALACYLPHPRSVQLLVQAFPRLNYLLIVRTAYP